jgi:glycosyltransferase involved in cell wall biosynthesis
MRVLMVAGIFPPDIGGPASYVPAMAAALAARGHRVEVVCLSDGAGHDDSAYPFAVCRLPRGVAKWRRLPATVREIARRAASADLVYANGLAFEAAAAAALARRPLVCKVVSDFAWERAVSWGWYAGTLESFRAAPRGPRLRLLERFRDWPLRRARAVVTPSVYLKDAAAGWGIPADRVHVVYNAFEPGDDDAGAALPPGGPVLLFAGRLTGVKRVDGILRILPELPGVRLAVAGDGALRGELEALARELGVDGRVLWLGGVSRARVMALCRQAALLVLNSSHEGLPHVAVEAMAAGVPVVATAVGGTPEVVEHGVTGVLVPPGDHAALRDAVAALLARPERAAEMGRAGRARVRERFGFEAMVDETERILALHAAVGPRRAPRAAGRVGEPHAG